MSKQGTRFGLLILLALLVASEVRADDGYELWLQNHPVSDAAMLQHYRVSIAELFMEGSSPTLLIAQKEIHRGLRGLLNEEIPLAHAVTREGSLVVGTPASSSLIASLDLGTDLQEAGEEGFVIRAVQIDGRRGMAITANTDIGVLYGVFHFLTQLHIL